MHMLSCSGGIDLLKVPESVQDALFIIEGAIQKKQRQWHLPTGKHMLS